MSVQTETVLFVGVELTKDEYTNLFGDIEEDFDEEENQSKLAYPLMYFYAPYANKNYVGCELGSMNGDYVVDETVINYADLSDLFATTARGLANINIDRYPQLMFKDVSK